MILAVKGSAHYEQSLISTALQTDWRSVNFWRQQEQLAAEMRVPYLIFHSHLPEDQWSLFALIHHQAINFSRIVIKALCEIVRHLTIGCTQRPRNWQKTGQSLKTRILCSYWLPAVTRVQLQTVHSFFFNRHYFSFLLDEWWYPVSS